MRKLDSGHESCRFIGFRLEKNDATIKRLHQRKGKKKTPPKRRLSDSVVGVNCVVKDVCPWIYFVGYESRWAMSSDPSRHTMKRLCGRLPVAARVAFKIVSLHISISSTGDVRRVALGKAILIFDLKDGPNPNTSSRCEQDEEKVPAHRRLKVVRSRLYNTNPP